MVDALYIGNSDGVPRVRLGTIMNGGKPTAIRAAAGTLTLDNRQLRLDQLRVELRSAC